jgi:hypothetical protein
MRLLLALLSGLGLAALIVLVAERAMAPAAVTVPAPAVAATARPAAGEPTTAEAQWAQAREVAWPALMARAEAGDAEAQFRRAMGMLTGAFEPANPDEARRWFLRAAKQGYGRALNALGECDSTEEFGAADHARAARYFQEAWKAGEPMGMFNLGLLAEHGLGRPRDVAEALRCFRQAADRGAPVALNRLGLICMEGDLAPKDERQAVAYFRQAAEKGDAQAWLNLTVAYRLGAGIPVSPTQALDCARQAWAQGEVDGGFLVGELLTETGGDPAEAIAYLLAARSCDGSPESAARFRRLVHPLLDKAGTTEARHRVTDTQRRLLVDRARRQFREIFGP